MTIKQWLDSSTKKLNASSVPTTQLDVEILLADKLKKDRSWLHAHPELLLQRSDLDILNEQITRRANHEPLAYIRGRSEFYGREFIVNAATLQPRSETETMIEILKSIAPLKIIDVGTGSGCIAITAKLELPNSYVLACDISDDCLEIAQKNATKFNVDISIVKSDLLLDVSAKNLSESTLCCNLPYVPLDFHINKAAQHEPDIALFGGKDGLDHYRKLFDQVVSLPKSYRPTHILTEALPPQHENLKDIAAVHDYTFTSSQDLIQHFTIMQYKSELTPI